MICIGRDNAKVGVQGGKGEVIKEKRNKGVCKRYPEEPGEE